ncbi:hypothetical protein [Nocardia wallacei]|uniref:hypothetical protein n=1 Tax=Nocardia wallacei TaxID=480035 RepID=UPI0024572725|nr:hypothetical protein [Nocardia wallacei]
MTRPIVAVVGDIFHHIQLYLAARDDTGTDRAFMITADGSEHALDRPSQAGLSEALVTNYLMRPAQRFQPLARQQQFLAALSAAPGDGKAKGRIGSTSGPSASPPVSPNSHSPHGFRRYRTWKLPAPQQGWVRPTTHRAVCRDSWLRA